MSNLFGIFVKRPKIDDLVKSHEWKIPAVSCRECSAVRQCFAATARNSVYFLIRSLTPQRLD